MTIFLKKIKYIVFSSLLFILLKIDVWAGDDFRDPPQLGDAFSVRRLGFSANKMGFDTAPSSPESVVATVISVVLSFLGIIFIILMIYGGILWMTASGNDQQVQKAQNIIKRSVIGMFIVLLAYSISAVILNIFIN